MADREAETYLRVLAEIMGVEAADDPQATRQAIEQALGVDKPGGSVGQMADALGVSSHGHHPEGRSSTVEELVLRYRAGELKDSYPLPRPEGAPSLAWFDESDLESYTSEDGFHPQAASYEFTKLWYQIVGEGLDLADCGDWHVAHGGLRWEYYGGATCGDLHSTVEAVVAASYVRYCEVSQVLEDSAEVVTPAEETWDAHSWGSILED